MWTPEEDEKLARLIEEHGAQKWSIIAAGLPGRAGKQCRERWHNHLHPGVRKDPWSTDEDVLIVKLQHQHGNKWAEISKHIPGRTDNAIKNRWNCSMKKKTEKFLSEVRRVGPDKAKEATCLADPVADALLEFIKGDLKVLHRSAVGKRKNKVEFSSKSKPKKRARAKDNSNLTIQRGGRAPTTSSSAACVGSNGPASSLRGRMQSVSLVSPSLTPSSSSTAPLTPVGLGVKFSSFPAVPGGVSDRRRGLLLPGQGDGVMRGEKHLRRCEAARGGMSREGDRKDHLLENQSSLVTPVTKQSGGEGGTPANAKMSPFWETPPITGFEALASQFSPLISPSALDDMMFSTGYSRDAYSIQAGASALKGLTPSPTRRLNCQLQNLSTPPPSSKLGLAGEKKAPPSSVASSTGSSGGIETLLLAAQSPETSRFLRLYTGLSPTSEKEDAKRGKRWLPLKQEFPVDAVAINMTERGRGGGFSME